MILTMTPDPIEISATRVYMDRGLTMATFGLYCAGVQEQARDTASAARLAQSSGAAR